MHFVQGTNRHQMQFTSPDDMITSDNPVRIIDAFVDKVDVQRIGVVSASLKSEGRPPFHPSLLLKLYLYGYLNRIRSSRRLEKECARNIEMQWLCVGLTPNYHTIANFRRDNPKALKALFKLFVLFLKDQDLIGAEIIAIDGSKFRAQNSKKNNYNQKKIDRHLTYIEEKTESYLQELDEMDSTENSSEDITISKEKIQTELKKLKDRKEKYHLLQEALNATEETQISTSDPDARALPIHRSIIEVAYNVQTAVDEKHSLMVVCETTNDTDRNALAPLALAAKEILSLEHLTSLSDKGYHNGGHIQKCEDAGITTLAAFQDHSNNSEKMHPEYYTSKFIYDKAADNYTCKKGHQLLTKGTWHEKKRENGKVSYLFKKYRTPHCKSCPVKHLCTGRAKGGREIERSQYQNAVDRNNERVRTQKELYLKRQAIVEHPFGTIKRSWGYSYTLLKGLQKVDGEMNLIALVYNLRRTINIMGSGLLITALDNWTPDYEKVLCALKTAPVKSIYIHFKPLPFLRQQPLLSKMIA
jgi:transposase